MALLCTVSQCFYEMNFILCQEQKALETVKAFAYVSMPITTFICQFWESHTERGKNTQLDMGRITKLHRLIFIKLNDN